MDILPDVLDSDLKIVFCGTAAGSMSVELGYYWSEPLKLDTMG